MTISTDFNGRRDLTAVSRGTPKAQTAVLHAFLTDDTAKGIIAKIEDPRPVAQRVVREILDRRLGQAQIAFPNPQNAHEERVLRLATPKPEEAKRVLRETPGIAFVL